MTAADYFAVAVNTARAQARRIYRDFEPAVRVGLTAIGPDNCTLVPCGEATFPRCQADQFEQGILTITSRDDESIVREYQPGEWTEAVCYGRDNDIDYVLTPENKR